MIKVSEIHVYPVKSLAGIKLKKSKLCPTGLKNDRRWMVIDENGKFMSQREFATMATILTSFVDGQLALSHKNNRILVPQIKSGKRIEVSIWNDTVQASHICQSVDKWLTSILNKKCHLVYMEDNDNRQIDTDYAQKDQYVSFADAFPLLVISQASLDDVNSRLTNRVNINRFRPNLVVTGTSAFAEDKWQDISINEIELKAVKLCSRCIMPSINQETGEQDQMELLSTLNRYRKVNKKIKFGQNLIFKDANQIDNQLISCGDEIKLKNI